MSGCLEEDLSAVRGTGESYCFTKIEATHVASHFRCRNLELGRYPFTGYLIIDIIRLTEPTTPLYNADKGVPFFGLYCLTTLVDKRMFLVIEYIYR